MFRTKQFWAAGLIVLFALGACGTSDNNSAAPSFKEVTQSTHGSNYGKKPAKAPGFDGKTISLGVITPLSGLAGFLGQAIENGSQTYWDGKNFAGGVDGKYKVELLSKDSAANGTYDKATSLAAYDELAPQVVAFQQVLGTDVILALKDKQVADPKIIAPATLSGSWVRNPLVMPIANPYQTQAINGIAYYKEKSEKSNPKVCSLALDDTFGDDGVAGVKFAVEKLGISYPDEEQFTTNSPVSAQVDNLVKSKCDAVVVVATAVDVGTIVGAFAQKDANMTLIGLSPLWIPEAELKMTSAAKDYATKNLWIVSSGAPWGDTTVEGMSRMIDDIDEFKPNQKSNPYFLYGYAQAWAMDQLLEQAAKNGDLSGRGVANALANVGTLDFGGLLPSYKYGPNSKSRVVPDSNTIFMYNPDDPSRLSPVSDDSIDFSSPVASKYTYK